MLELPTNNPNFLFKNTQDFNQTTHVGPQELKVIIDNIILYFNYLISVLHVFKRSHNGMSQRGVRFQIFWLKCGTLYELFISPIWLMAADFAVQICKYALPISNPNILF